MYIPGNICIPEVEHLVYTSGAMHTCSIVPQQCLHIVEATVLDQKSALLSLAFLACHAEP